MAWAVLMAAADAGGFNWTALFTTGGGMLVTLFGSWLVFRKGKGDQRTEGAKTEASATTAFLEGQKAFQEYVNGVVAGEVREAVADLQRQVEALQAQLADLRRESHEMNDAYRTHTTHLWLWNVRGRLGPMPELPEHILRKLGLIHLSTLGDLEDTQPVRPADPT